MWYLMIDLIESYIVTMHSRSEFSSLKGIDDFAQEIVDTKTNYVSNCLFACYIDFDSSRYNTTLGITFSIINIVKIN